MAARLLIVEDDPALAELLIWHFEAEGYEVRHTADGEEALLLAAEETPDAIILDWMIENISGIEVCRRLRRVSETSAVPIIMLTARGEEEDRIRGLDTGADDYVTKPFSPRELIARLAAVLRRSRPALVGKTLKVEDIELDPTAHRVRRGGVEINLGPTEFRMLQHFMERPGRVLTRGQLVTGVWGNDSDIEERTVDVQIKRLRAALNIGGGKDVIRTVRSAGYSLG
ncbi:MAG: phosphate regulon transcriptional regulatory protein PhoB [Sphingomonadaceae bacterium]|jgi:two-component system phosphate regulon response regulator PhoB|nr:phosphate regulon transcriptional regulatory protein PhoB [Sphingomonadaceae bacterium]NBU78199.1 phosphate regulon transcriptional regulatory protein PhoB [Sphingomonadaceae bacterium]NCA01635.1 phosphate regulon transcriptional regulatory protein PhoB [Sphingomonadaceae bacterium]